MKTLAFFVCLVSLSLITPVRSGAQCDQGHPPCESNVNGWEQPDPLQPPDCRGDSTRMTWVECFLVDDCQPPDPNCISDNPCVQYRVRNDNACYDIVGIEFQAA